MGRGAGLAERTDEKGLSQSPPGPRRKRSSRRPLFRGYHLAFTALGAVLLMELAAAAIVGRLVFQVSPARLFQVGNLGQALAIWLLPPLIWLGLVTIQLVRRRVERPTRTLLRLLRFRSDWLLRGVIILAAYPLMVRSFALLKSAIPRINPFYLDPTLVKIDQWILGADAWRVTHELMPAWFLVAIDRVYFLWFTYLVLVTGIIAFSRDPRFQIRGALAFHACWFLLGTCLATALSSVGPWYYDHTFGGRHFSALTSALAATHEERGLLAVYAMQFLERNAGTTNVGAGISAMPSMHIAIAFLGFLLATQYPRKLWLKWFTGTFTLFTLVGSVYLGWHYLSDGLVAIVVVWLVWIGVGRFVDRVYRPSTSSQSFGQPTASKQN